MREKKGGGGKEKQVRGHDGWSQASVSVLSFPGEEGRAPDDCPLSAFLCPGGHPVTFRSSSVAFSL